MKGYTIQHSIELLEKNGGSGSGGASTAAQVSYDNTSSGLSGTNVQSAIDEVNAKIIGIFFDSTNVIQAKTDVSTTATYTTTQDCIIQCEFIIPGATSGSLLCDGVAMFSHYATGQTSIVNMFYVPKGKTVTISGGASGGVSTNYTVYGLYRPTVAKSRKKK